MLSSTKYKHDRIEGLVREFAGTREFDGMAIAVMSLQGKNVHSSLSQAIGDENAKIGLQTLIDDINNRTIKTY